MTQEDNQDSYIDKLFEGDESDVVEENAQQEQTQEQETESKPEVEASEPKESETTSEEKEEEESKEVWTKAAVLDERRKRQEYEKRVEELEAKIKGFEEKTIEKEPVKAPDPIDDPEGFNQYQDRKVFNLALKFDQRQMQKDHKDYDEVVSHFKKMAGENPALVETFQKQEFPATYAYNTAKSDLNSKKYSDPNFLENLEKELEAKILAKLKAESPVDSKPDASKLPKLNSATSVASNIETKVEVNEEDFSGMFKSLGY